MFKIINCAFPFVMHLYPWPYAWLSQNALPPLCMTSFMNDPIILIQGRETFSLFISHYLSGWNIQWIYIQYNCLRMWKNWTLGPNKRILFSHWSRLHPFMVAQLTEHQLWIGIASLGPAIQIPKPPCYFLILFWM